MFETLLTHPCSREVRSAIARVKAYDISEQAAGDEMQWEVHFVFECIQTRGISKWRHDAGIRRGAES